VLTSEHVCLESESVSMHPVIRVDARDQICLAILGTPNQALDDSLVGLGEDAEARISPGHSAGNVEAAVAGPIVENHALEIDLLLSPDAAQASVECRLRVPDWEKNGNSRFRVFH